MYNHVSNRTPTLFLGPSIRNRSRLSRSLIRLLTVGWSVKRMIGCRGKPYVETRVTWVILSRTRRRRALRKVAALRVVKIKIVGSLGRLLVMMMPLVLLLLNRNGLVESKKCLRCVRRKEVFLRGGNFGELLWFFPRCRGKRGQLGLIGVGECVAWVSSEGNEEGWRRVHQYLAGS